MALQISYTNFKHYSTPKCKMHTHSIGRRSLAVATILTVKEAALTSKTAYSFEFRITVPNQTPDEANAVVKQHARDLVKIKPLIDSESWNEVQNALRESSSLLKQDLYTLIQAKPGSQRPYLRKLYSEIFYNVSRLDYAARDRDKSRVDECYNNMFATLKEFFDRLYQVD